MAASATMSELPNELILDISHHLPKASDRLELTLTNRRMSRLIGSTLYKHVVISKATYDLKCRELGDNPSFSTYAAIRSLARTLRRNKHYFGSAIPFRNQRPIQTEYQELWTYTSHTTV